MSVMGRAWVKDQKLMAMIAKQTYIGAIISKVVDNVQIQVSGIHLRYEDETNTPEVSFYFLVIRTGAV